MVVAWLRLRGGLLQINLPFPLPPPPKGNRREIIYQPLLNKGYSTTEEKEEKTVEANVRTERVSPHRNITFLFICSLRFPNNFFLKFEINSRFYGRYLREILRILHRCVRLLLPYRSFQSKGVRKKGEKEGGGRGGDNKGFAAAAFAL